RSVVSDPPVVHGPGSCGGAVLPPDRPAGGHQAGTHGRGADWPAADATDRRKHGRLYQRDRRWSGRGGRGPFAPRPTFPGRRGDGGGGGDGVRDPVSRLRDTALPAGSGGGAGVVRG